MKVFTQNFLSSTLVRSCDMRYSAIAMPPAVADASAWASTSSSSSTSLWIRAPFLAIISLCRLFIMARCAGVAFGKLISFSLRSSMKKASGACPVAAFAGPLSAFLEPIVSFLAGRSGLFELAHDPALDCARHAACAHGIGDVDDRIVFVPP